MRHSSFVDIALSLSVRWHGVSFLDGILRSSLGFRDAINASVVILVARGVVDTGLYAIFGNEALPLLERGSL
jgi:hypothetical protein